MRLLRLALLLSIATFALAVVGAATPQMGVSEIRPGMVGIGRTVFEGTRVDEFTAKILGVIENVIGTHRNLILARLEGRTVGDHAGVIAGMSSSPVYIDGRLIGAVSYALGAFSKEPIAGITPIDEMTDATGLSETRPRSARLQLDFPLTRENLTTAFRRALNWNRPFAERPDDVQFAGVAGISGVRDDRLGTLLRPIATPLAISGFEPEIAEMLGSAFRDQGFVPTGGGTAGTGAGEMPFEGPLKPGDAVGVNFLTGDLSMGATGTVTHVDADRVYAFGHPMYNLGPTEFPMTRAYVYTVLPSLSSSLKLSTTGDTIGTFLQDRATAIAGRLGPGPRMIPISLTLEAQRGPKHTFHFNVVNDQIFTPLMTYAAILETIGSYERQNGTATYTVRGKVRVKNYDDINFDNLFSGDQASAGAASYMVAPITYLVANDYEKVDLEGLDFTIASSEEPKTATLQRVWIDEVRPRAGRTVPLKIALRTFRGEDVVKTLPVQIPANATGTLSILVSDGTRLGQSELRESRLPQQQRNVAQLIRTLNKGRRNNALYVKLLGSDAGAVVNGESLSSLPPSVLAVLEADRNGGNFNPLQTATLGEWELSTDNAVSGSRTLTVAIAN